jgi:gliding motility-associated-like protein
MSAQQNLVPNGSFEDTVYCPTGTNDPGALSTWYNPTMASPDYYNSCANNGGGVPINDWGYQYAQHGKAYIGVATYYSTLVNYREYIQIKLSSKLEANKSYCWSFWISLLDSVDFASNNIGIGLSQNPITDFASESLLAINNYGFDAEIYLDRNIWKKVTGTFVANGQEEYLTLGNFFDDSNTNFTQIATNSIGGEGAYYFIDNVFIGDCISLVLIPNVFSPNNDLINDKFCLETNGISDLKITIMNRWGQIVYEGFDNPNWDGKYQDEECSEGLYFYLSTYKNIQTNFYETKTGFIQLIR